MSSIKAAHQNAPVRDSGAASDALLLPLSSPGAEVLDFAQAIAGKCAQDETPVERRSMPCKSISTTPLPSPAEDRDEESKVASTDRRARKDRRTSVDDPPPNGLVAISAVLDVPSELAAALTTAGSGTAGQPARQPVTGEPIDQNQAKPADSAGQESALAPPADARMALLRTPGETPKTPSEGQKLPGSERGETELPGAPRIESPGDKIYKKTESVVLQAQDGTGESGQNGPESAENGLAAPLQAGAGKAAKTAGETPENQAFNPGGTVDASGQLAVNRKMTMNEFARQFEQELPSEDLKGQDALPVSSSKHHDLSGAEDQNAITPIGVDAMGLKSSSLASVPAVPLQEAARGAGVVEKIEHAIAVHTMELQRLNATTLHAVIQPVPGTELHLRVYWNGQNVEAQLRGGPGSEEFLKSHWGQLQESLGAKGIVLAPAETKPTTSFTPGEGRDTGAGRQKNPQEFQRGEPATLEEKQNHFRQGSRETKINHRHESQAAGKTTRMLESWA